MNIAILGGTGFIGSALVQHFLRQGDEVSLFTRDPVRIQRSNDHRLTVHKWPIQHSLNVDAVINLAGETINQRWTTAAKKRIHLSRTETTRILVKEMEQGRLKTKTLINGSAVGFYGDSLKATFSEDDAPQTEATDFLQQVTRDWETQADQVSALEVRLIKARFGVVLGCEGGALPRMVLPYRFFVGGPIGSGTQWVSWIHINDVVQLVDFCLRREIHGVVNFTAPNPCTMNELGKTIAAKIHRPHWLPLPSLALKWGIGQMSDLILKGQKVIPKKSLDSGYSFQFETIEQALGQLLQEVRG